VKIHSWKDMSWGGFAASIFRRRYQRERSMTHASSTGPE